jgi:uncharacterized hydrophobic protein (TIGR00271 family)
LRRDESELARVRATVASGAAITGPYLAMNTAAALLASFGLLQNSPAVIIGAMLVAMLFGPIVGIALGLAQADMSLLSRSFASELVGVVCVLAIGYALGLVSTSLPIGSEIVSRTSPSVLDPLIGLVGGLAGGFTLVSTELVGVLVGVAIATALVPPLASCGILLARGMYDPAAGAFLLFLANFTAIAVGAMIVLRVTGHRPAVSEGAYRVMVPRVVSEALFAVLAVHLTMNFHRTLGRAHLAASVEGSIAREIGRISGVRTVNVSVAGDTAKLVACVVVCAPVPVTPERVAHLNDVVNRASGSEVELHVRSVITAETTRDGYVYGPVSPSSEDTALR